jgi:hypothetical protein
MVCSGIHPHYSVPHSLTIAQKGPPGGGKYSSITGKEADKVAMFSWEFREWGQPRISREENSTIQEPLSPRVSPPTLRRPPSHPSSERNRLALPRRLAKDPGATQQRLGQTWGSGDPHAMVVNRPDSERALLQGSNSNGSELGSRATSR